MRSGPNTRRMRGRGNGNARRGGSPRSHNFDSNGPGIKVRGNAQQIVDKYQTLAREATIAGDRVMAENYNQHAEHYYRILSAQAAELQQNNQQNQQQNNQQNNQRNQNQEGSGSDRPQNQPNTQADNRNGTRHENGAGQANGAQPIEVRPTEQTAPPAVETPAVEAPAVEAPAVEAPEQSTTPATTDGEETPKPRTRRAPRRRTTPRPAPVEGTSETTS